LRMPIYNECIPSSLSKIKCRTFSDGLYISTLRLTPKLIVLANVFSEEEEKE
jgi:hypothetical protein